MKQRDIYVPSDSKLVDITTMRAHAILKSKEGPVTIHRHLAVHNCQGSQHEYYIGGRKDDGARTNQVSQSQL